jgi:hypothetical protein
LIERRSPFAFFPRERELAGPKGWGAVAEAVNEGWNTFEIALDPPENVVSLNGLVVNRFTAADPARVDLGRGFVGLQNHGPGDVVVFRRVQVSPD